MELYFYAIIILAALAVSDLIVGVSNDAVNFLNSSIGSKVAPRYIIFIIASFGMIAGVTFSKGMMEVARKGIFHPKYFNMPELIIIFLAVMLTDVILLDLYNTFGLPTSTTVSIVFELLGAAVAVSLVKISRADQGLGELVKYINTGKALAIISGILLSVAVAFICGAVVQFISRMVFTFNYQAQLKRYGAIWGGLALSAIMYFILIKGAKGSTFITKETLTWIKANTVMILAVGFVVSAVLLFLLQMLTKINVLKPVVLVGTFALAMAFAANDLVNFIGVPLAGMNAYKIAGDLTTPMTELQKATPSDTLFLVIAGIIMAITLWFSKKARTVTKTELNLGRQDEGVENFGSSSLARSVVRATRSGGNGMRKLIPAGAMNFMNSRFEEVKEAGFNNSEEKPMFDLVRASVNLMVAGILISIGTSLKLPLSTTYVTFMVAMGTSFSDRAWGRDSAVYRVTGVFTVIGGWFLTAMMAFTISGIFALIIITTGLSGAIAVMIVCGITIYKNHTTHKKRAKVQEEDEIFNLKKVENSNDAVETTFEHVGTYLKEVAEVIDRSFTGLAQERRTLLKESKREIKKLRRWTNIITANIFKTLRAFQKDENIQGYVKEYAGTISALQGIGDSQSDLVKRSYLHVDNNHKGLLDVQLKELSEVKQKVVDLLNSASESFLNKNLKGTSTLESERSDLIALCKGYDENQVSRIQDESSKTRLSIMFYATIRSYTSIINDTIKLIEVFENINDKK